MLAKSFSSAQGDRKKEYPSQEDILEWAKPALPLEEEFDDLFLEDLVGDRKSTRLNSSHSS